MTRQRTFVALPLSDEANAAVEGLRAVLPPAPHGLHWTVAQQLHLTLAFLGDLDAEELADVRAAARSSAAEHAPFDADLRGLGAFPHAGRARVAWVGWGDGAGAVGTLQSALVRALARPADRRPFSPHVTIARARDPLDLRTWLASAPTWASPAWRVGAIDVMTSELAREGAVHTLVEHCPLATSG